MKYLRQTYFYLFYLVVLLPRFTFAGLFDGQILPECDVECKWEDFVEFANNLLRLMIDIAVVIAGFAILYAAYQYVSARGSTEKIKKGHAALQHALVGLILVLSAWLLMDIFLQMLTGKGVDEWSNPANF